jgi:hypothetical protein
VSNEWNSATGQGVMTLDRAVTSIEDKAFVENHALTSITIPNGVTSIGMIAFNKCVNLASVNLPNSVTIIKTGAFAGCASLKRVTLPSSIKMVDMYAFSDCTKLESIYCLATTPPTLEGKDVFANNASNRTIYVLKTSISKYLSAAVWSSFKSVIKPFDGTVPAEPRSKSSSKKPYSSTQKLYKIGDVITISGVKGVVFEVTDGGKHGKAISVKRSSGYLKWSSDENEQKRLIGAVDAQNGANNMAKVKQISDWQNKYPAFKWCADLGEGWYLPAKTELLAIYKVKDAVNTTFSSQGAETLTGEKYNWYWSSTEYNYRLSTGEFCAWYVYMLDGSTYGNHKRCNVCVRAVATF